MNNNTLKKNWILLVSHRPEKDPRIGWIRAHAPEDIAINCVALDRDISEPRIEKDQNGITVTIPYHLESNNENWVSELCINKRDSIAAKIYLWLGHFQKAKPNRYSTLAVFEKHDCKERSLLLLSLLLDIRELTDRLVSATIHLDGICGIIAADFDTLLSASILKEILNVPVVYDAHEYRSEEDHHAGVFEKNIFKDLEKQLLNYADARFIVSDGLRDLATNELGYEFETLPNAIPLVIKSQTRLRKADENYHFIFLGGMGEGRGLEKLIDNWRDTEPNCLLYLQGPDSPFKDKLKQLANTTGILGKRIFFPNASLETELLDALKGYDIGIIPYEPVCINNKFCCPNKLSQYMASGLAILANDTEYVKEMLLKYECGLTVDFNKKNLFLDAVKILVSNTNLEQMQINAEKAHQKKYHWETVSNNFYNSVSKCSLKIKRNSLEFPINPILNDKKISSHEHRKRHKYTLAELFIMSLIKIYRFIVPKKIRVEVWRVATSYL